VGSARDPNLAVMSRIPTFHRAETLPVTIVLIILARTSHVIIHLPFL
jgi:hypothetical protein